MPRTRTWVVAACLWLTVVDAAAAMKIEGVEFASQAQAAGTTLHLHNTALFRYRIFLKAYVGALYLGSDVAAQRVLEDVPKRLELEYFWSISAPDFAAATSQGIANNVDAKTLAGLQPRIARMKRLYRDVKPGDRYSLTYVPGAGTELALNGKPLGAIEGADFAAAIFAIWLGPRPIDDSFRDDLLTRR